MNKVTTVGIDLAKRVFALHGIDAAGAVRLRRMCRREKLVPCLIGMEACGGAHEWARRFEGFGHTVRLMAPKFVRPYRKAGKNDFNDAEAISEAVGDRAHGLGAYNSNPLGLGVTGTSSGLGVGDVPSTSAGTFTRQFDAAINRIDQPQDSGGLTGTRAVGLSTTSQTDSFNRAMDEVAQQHETQIAKQRAEEEARREQAAARERARIEEALRREQELARQREAQERAWQEQQAEAARQAQHEDAGWEWRQRVVGRICSQGTINYPEYCAHWYLYGEHHPDSPYNDGGGGYRFHPSHQTLEDLCAEYPHSCY